MEQVVTTSLSQIRETGQAFHAEYFMEKLEKVSWPLSDIILRNNMQTFASWPQEKLRTRVVYIDKT